MAMKNWCWNPYVHMMVPANTAFDLKPKVKVSDSCVPFSVDLSIVDRLRELECIDDVVAVE